MPLDNLIAMVAVPGALTPNPIRYGAADERAVPTIQVVTQIRAPLDRCFDLARSVDIHRLSAAHTRERAVAGVTSGLLELGDLVTWEATHFGVRQRLTVAITEYDRPRRFVDELVRGPFHTLRHVHEFSRDQEVTRMIDAFDFESPLGVLGQLANGLILTNYMRNFLQRRALYLKRVAEEDGV